MKRWMLPCAVLVLVMVGFVMAQTPAVPEPAESDLVSGVELGGRFRLVPTDSAIERMEIMAGGEKVYDVLIYRDGADDLDRLVFDRHDGHRWTIEDPAARGLKDLVLLGRAIDALKGGHAD
ncbi:MAG: hypothetical protein ACOCTI_06180 [Phycisphaeraceae bacterium]